MSFNSSFRVNKTGIK